MSPTPRGALSVPPFATSRLAADTLHNWTSDMDGPVATVTLPAMVML